MAFYIVLWITFDWLKKFYRLYITALVVTISRRGLRIEEFQRSQPNRAKLPLYKQFIFALKIT